MASFHLGNCPSDKLVTPGNGRFKCLDGEQDDGFLVIFPESKCVGPLLFGKNQAFSLYTGRYPTTDILLYGTMIRNLHFGLAVVLGSSS